jgi:hypothetical protein
MLYGANLGVEFWADALVYAAYLYNRTYHDAIGKTPYEAWTQIKPEMSHIGTFGSSVTAKKPGRRPTKGDPHCYHGIFLRYTATNKNLVYYDVNTKRTKTATHKRLDEFHYGNPINQRPKMAQHMIDITLDDLKKKKEYGRPLPLQEFEDVQAIPDHPAGAAAKLDASAANSSTEAMIATLHDDPSTEAMNATIYEPSSRYQDSNILNIEMSLDIFGPSTTEVLTINP